MLHSHWNQYINIHYISTERILNVSRTLVAYRHWANNKTGTVLTLFWSFNTYIVCLSSNFELAFDYLVRVKSNYLRKANLEVSFGRLEFLDEADT